MRSFPDRKAMKTITTIDGMKKFSDAAKKSGKTIGFVPTMGYLHYGHASLINASAKECDLTVVSVFVNPTQFGPKEDLEKYPRDPARDRRVSKKAGADVIFAPSEEEMYPEGYSTWVSVEGSSTSTLCSRSRPGHFRGVATVVAKLLNIVSPDRAYFGQKDAQQAVVIKRMARDLNMVPMIRVMPIVREKDGLAMSSRNVYLSPSERKEALGLSMALAAAGDLIVGGERSSSVIKKKMAGMLKGGRTKVDYIEIVDADTLLKKDSVGEGTLIAVAAFVGKTRLIDNMLVRK